MKPLVFFVGLFLCLLPWTSPPMVLIMGIGFALVFGTIYPERLRGMTHFFLQTSVVGLGFSIHLDTIVETGRLGLTLAFVAIVAALLLGFLLGKWLKVSHKTSSLIASGTAICGASAIAAMSPVIRANEKEIAIALSTIFLLNSLALLIFPYLGLWLELTPKQFGIWAAIAIHDTSSVVGAAAQYSTEAMQIAVPMKLIRALYIVPLIFLMAFMVKNRSQKLYLPLFMILFVFASLAYSYIPVVQTYSEHIVGLAKISLKLALFLIGTSLTHDLLRSIGFRPLIQGCLLWLTLASSSLWAVCYFL